jgi:hypothetical protein
MRKIVVLAALAFVLVAGTAVVSIPFAVAIAALAFALIAGTAVGGTAIAPLCVPSTSSS